MKLKEVKLVRHLKRGDIIAVKTKFKKVSQIQQAFPFKLNGDAKTLLLEDNTTVTYLSKYKINTYEV